MGKNGGVMPSDFFGVLLSTISSLLESIAASGISM
jgi:hypothetical protein